MTKEKKVSVTIDNKQVEVRPNSTILQAARDNNIYIPSMCTLEHLPSYGACRLCIVEVDGLRGFPTSCTTPAEAGMVIRTDTAEIKGLRQEILKLLLSEHPASCLFCDEHDECKKYMGTIRKVGVTTGCRYCPNDTCCELQEIVDKVGLTETSYPVYYRGFPVEKYDPFYDRDYNLCILCGRCVRVCNSVRLNGTLAFKQRGKLTTIGPAFDRTHLEAGCEFCGACVTVCPTGALSTKASKWYGMPDAKVATTCTFCSSGCRLMLHVKNDEVIDALPDYDSVVDQGLICVKGRFAVPEYVNSPQRFTVPQRMTPVGYSRNGFATVVKRGSFRGPAVREAGPWLRDDAIVTDG
jgi:predicted molibdopterin-dependent oxidoreductase YjgC